MGYLGPNIQVASGISGANMEIASGISGAEQGGSKWDI